MIVVSALAGLAGFASGNGAGHWGGLEPTLPSSVVLALASALSLLAMSHERVRHARVLAWGTIAGTLVVMASAASAHPVPVDAWLLGAPPIVTPVRSALAMVQGVLGLCIPASVLLLARGGTSERRLLAVTGGGMLLVGGALLLAILHTTRITTSNDEPLGAVSLLGLLTPMLGGVSLFLLVARRQAVPRVPPRWSPEMAGVLTLVCTVAIWYALELRLRSDAAAAPPFALPELALLLGVTVAVLTCLVLRLLRANWLQAHELARAELARAFDTATDGVWEYDVVLARMRRSAAQVRHLGYVPDAPDDRDGDAWLPLVHEDDRSLVRAHLDRAYHDDDAYTEIRYRVRDSQGDYHTIVDRGRVLSRLPDGGPRIILGISADLTERERADRARRDSEQRFRAIFDSALRGQVLVSADGSCLEVNSTALDIAGVERRDVVGVPFAASPWFTGLTDAQATIARHLEAASEGASVRFEVPCHRLDGRVGRLECSMTPLACDAGVVQQVLCEMQDVTERRQADHALREIGALTTMGRLAARVAHEINNPLAGIQNAFLLLGDAIPADHPHRRFLQSIEREIQRIAAVTRSLYETYRHDDGHAAAASLPTVVRDAVTFLDQVNRGRGIRIEVDLTTAPPMVPVPDALLRQTLYNLVQNAVDASPTGGTVSVTAGLDGPQCVITVGDEGARVPEHLRESIFEAFGRTRSAQSRSGSMGVGLALVKQSVEALGGSVQLLDRPTGATFEVRFPMTSVLLPEQWVARTTGTPQL